MIKVYGEEEGDIELKIIYEDTAQAFIALEILTSSPYVVGIIYARNYYTVLLVLIINALSFCIFYLTFSLDYFDL